MSFTIGHPTETMETLNSTIDLMLELPIDVVGVTHFTAYPGSPIHPSIAKYGAFDPDWNNVNTYDVGNFIPDGFTAEQLTELRRKAIRRFYLRPRYVFSQIMAIKITKGNVDDRTPVAELTKKLKGFIYADKGYIGATKEA